MGGLQAGAYRERNAQKKNINWLVSSLPFWESGTVQWPFYQTEYSFKQGVSRSITPDVQN